MKINGSHIGPVNPAQMRKVTRVDAGSEVAYSKAVDQVLLSHDAGAVEAAKQVIANTPDIRMEKVESLRQQVQDGSYHVSAIDIASRMLTEGRLSKLGNK